MEAKFTKGKWVVDNSGSAVIIKDSGGYVGYPSHKGAIASLDDGEYIENGNKHDAHLIAAAPDMYAMIKELAHELNIAIDECNEYRAKGINSSTENEPDYIDKQTVHEAQLLLAKARGE